MRCVLCDQDVEIDDDSPVAKRARENPAFVFVCPACQRRNVDRYGIREEKGNPAVRSVRSHRRNFS